MREEALSARTYEELLAAALTDPGAEEALRARFCAPAAVLIIGVKDGPARMAREGPVHALAVTRAAQRTLLEAAQGHAPRGIRSLRDGLLLSFDRPDRAVLAAFDGLLALDELNRRRQGARSDGSRAELIGAGAALGHGELLLDPDGDATGLEVNAAFHLAGAAVAGELLATDAFIAALGAPPVGVGMHRGRADRAHQLGLFFSVLRDYRA